MLSACSLDTLPLASNTLATDLRWATVEGGGGVAEAEHAFVSNPVYDRGHTVAYPAPQSSLSANWIITIFTAEQNIPTEFNIKMSKEIVTVVLGKALWTSKNYWRSRFGITNY